MKVLIVKTSSLGDVIHMLPAITDAVQARPNLQLDWLVEESFAAIPAWHPAVKQVIPVAMRRWKKSWRSRNTWHEIQQTRERLNRERYDLVIDTQGLVKSALWCGLIQASSAGYDRSSAREPLAAFFYDHRWRVAKQQHAIDRNRQLMAQVLGYALHDPLPDYGLQELAQRLPHPELALPPNTVMGLHGTSRADKLWPQDRWQVLAKELAARSLNLALPWGNVEEHARAQAIAVEHPNVQVLPKLGLNALACLIDQAVAVVGVDTGLLHLAAALGKPGVALYTATPPALTGAVSDRQARQPLQNMSTPTELLVESVLQVLLKDSQVFSSN
jgi:heptosyltransferase I